MVLRGFLAALAAAASLGAAHAADAPAPRGIDRIDTLVVIYAENRSFDNLYGFFPGANGLQHVPRAKYVQRDRDGTVMTELPRIWSGLTAAGVTPPVTEAMTAHLPNRPFAIDDAKGFDEPLNVIHRDLWHRFYEEQMQLDGGKNDKFAAWADSGGLVMGHYQGGAKLPLWAIARRYTLADNFFQGAFGGSFANHFMLICACAPVYPDAATSPAKPAIAAVDADGISLTVAANSPKSALEGAPKFVSDGNITPDGYAVNTMQPPYQPSHNKPAPDGDPALADPMQPDTLPPQTFATIGDLLTRERRRMGLVRRRVAGGARRQERHARAEFPIPPPALQLHGGFGARHTSARRASARRRHERRAFHQGDRRK